jgi:DNA-binding response OmpR family regulator
VDVPLLRWPAAEAARAELAARGMPRLLVVPADAAPPRCIDPLEDWVREPVAAGDVDARLATLTRRAVAQECRPRIDEAGTLWVGARSVVLPAVQVPVARLLVARFAQVVPADQIRAAYRAGGGSTHPKAVKAMIGRVRQRVAELELTLANVRDRGYLLAPGGAGELSI